jgi:hypothetical protein
MNMTKHGVVEDIPANKIPKYLAHGWEPVPPEEETVRPKATVKTKDTAKTLDDITQQGDE